LCLCEQLGDIADDGVCGVQKGYEARHVTASVTIKGMLAYVEANEDTSDAAKRAALSCAFDVLPMTEVGVGFWLDAFRSDGGPSVCPQACSVLHSLAVRGLDTGTICMCGCFGQTLNVPVVPLDYLCDFFKAEEVRVFKIARVALQEARMDRAEIEPTDPLPTLLSQNVSEGSLLDQELLTEDTQVADSDDSLSASDNDGPPEHVAPQPVIEKVQWVDEVDKEVSPVAAAHTTQVYQPPPPAPAPVPVRKPVEPKPPPPAKPMAPQITLEQRVRQVEDVMKRFQLLMDVQEQSIGRLDDETQRLSIFQGKSKSIVNELRSQMSVVMKLVGPERVNAAMQEESTQFHLEGAFRNKQVDGRYRQGGGHQPDYSDPARGGQAWRGRGAPVRGGGGRGGGGGGGGRRVYAADNGGM
jgi:hypothetical protein